MKSNANPGVLRAAGLTLLTLAAIAPWAGAFAGATKASLPAQRKSTDPPTMAKGKLGQDLFLAIDHRDLAEVQALLKRGADPNSRNGLEFTPLYIAAASHQPDVMKALLDAGAQPEAASQYGTPLTFAAITGHAAGARMLIAKGADVNTTRIDGITVLMMAALSGNPDLMGELLKRKADVQATNNVEASALTYAARAGHVQIGRMLIDAGAKVDNEDEDKQTPLMTAAKTGHAEFVKMLLERGAKVNARDKQGRTALILAAAYGDYPEVVSALKGAGANLGAVDAKGQTAAMLAAARGYKESAALLGKTAMPEPAKKADDAIKSSLKLLELSMSAFNKGAACISCHQEGLGRMATASARSHGYEVRDDLNKVQLGKIRMALGFMKAPNEQALKNPEAMKQLPLIEINEVTPMSTWLLAGMAAQNDPATEATAAMAMVLARQQLPDGSWAFSLPRVPMQSTPFTYTALAIKSLQTYGPKASQAEVAGRIEKAKGWLLKVPAKSSDDLAFRLLGLKWAGASADEKRGAIQELLAAQRPDGGWSQMPGMHSDAYATGQALYALKVAGSVEAEDAAFVRGTRYLLRTQDPDGSWFVSKRAIPANNYLDAAFPHGESQYASFNGTSWAMMALLETLPRK